MPDADEVRPPMDFHGIAVTYAKVVSAAARWAPHVTERTLIIADEAHHLGEELAWGESFNAAFSRAKRWLLLSGTLSWLVRPRAQSSSRKKHNVDLSNGGRTGPTAPRATASISGLPPAKHSRVLNRAGIRFPVRTIPIPQEMDL